ncbi:SAF domain-containing protein [Propionibacterium acidifaciens]|uniref:SAF domain-containing protein n=1 Tax=Propionibacterium acidifaciens TaxID=556499 RepID=UPI0023F0F149|nr:SAF domain-containing protein [Propionibacterium acidifaciens]
MNVSSWISSVLRAVRWHRRGLAVVAAACALVLALAALSPGSGPTRTVVVSARDLAAGVVVDADDVTTAELPVGAVPASALTDPAQIVGQLLAAPRPGGATLLNEDVVSSSLVSASDGLSLVPFRITDAAIASILEVGDLISVVTLGPDGQSVPVVDRVRIAALPAPAEAGAIGGSGSSGALVVVTADADQAALLAAASSSYEMGIILEAP